MSQQTFEIQQAGIRAFPEPNRLDFVLEQPGEDKQRATMFFNNMERDVKLAGKKLTVLPAEYDEDGNPVKPNTLTVRWGRQVVTLGLCQTKTNRPYYYRSLETANDRARPKTAEELLAAMGLTQ